LKNGFKELFGDTIHNVVNNYKMDIALKMLSEGQTKANQVAFDLGFSSLQHFSKAFRQKFGYPPSQVKK
jgi:AraC-like DNA-binding protein